MRDACLDGSVDVGTDRGEALLIGAGFGFFMPVRQRAVAGVMAFGSGVLISALAFEEGRSLQARRVQLDSDWTVQRIPKR